jgi:glutaminyl-peptide cyclotransferase
VRLPVGSSVLGLCLSLGLLAISGAPPRALAGQAPAPGPVCSSPLPDLAQLPPDLQSTYQVVATYPHDPSAFVEGLVWFDNGFFESTGLFGQSTLRRVEFPSGTVSNAVDLSQDLFGEGLAMVDDRLVQLTWQSHIGFVYDRSSLSRTASFPYPLDGWGLTYDGADLIASDGSDALTVLDPLSYQPIGSVHVTIGGCPVHNINELEWIDGEIWANVWLTDIVIRIDPTSGTVTSYVDLSGLRDPAAASNRDAVLNGIAYDPDQQRLFVTGKLWSRLYQIDVPAQPAARTP